MSNKCLIPWMNKCIMPCILKDAPCMKISFSLNDSVNTQLLCEAPALSQVNSVFINSGAYPGGRGINLIVDPITTTFSNLQSASPSGNAQYDYTDMASYYYNATGGATVWFKGFISPETTSTYEFTIKTNGYAIVELGRHSWS